ncbi:unnamed protein product [Macrosiphum euphorbiae]|uniref:Uncharacterized protein n=1 Tax=Macrosiphum euphorbiae TaxID=13131 RepID=A0AAV0WB49_9HEMI|nr:unnamed protein product [Macrosiphum euphorbiae]
MIRQATGPNDHPATPTFLQVYQIVSSYSILKPPKSGNCMILETKTPKITLSDVKNVYESNQSERITKITNLEDKLNQISNEGIWEADDIFDHDDCQSSVKNCVTYYMWIC